MSTHVPISTSLYTLRDSPLIGAGDMEEEEGGGGENNPHQPGRNSHVQFPAGSLTSWCVCVSCRLYERPVEGEAFSPHCYLAGGFENR